MFDIRRFSNDLLGLKTSTPPLERKSSGAKSQFECEPITAGPGACTECNYCGRFANQPGSTRCANCDHEYIYHAAS
jgi:hypothetical protein